MAVKPLSKVIVLLVCMTSTLINSSQSASLKCCYHNNINWGTLGTVYFCDVCNYPAITTPDAAHIDSITGSHLSGYNNENVVAISVNLKDPVNYFPRGINKVYSNIKGIQIYNCSLKEIHKEDLKYFPTLVDLRLQYGQLEVLEEDLFEFNPHLDAIFLSFNKITHIDPYIADKLTNLKYFYTFGNLCISTDVNNNSTAVQEVIKAAKCTSLDYSNLNQKVKNFEIESQNLNSQDLWKTVENLEDEIKNSRFENFFQDKLKVLKAAAVKKEKDEFFDTIAGLFEANSREQCSAVEPKYDNIINKLAVQDIKMAGIEEKLVHISDAIGMINKNYDDMNKKITNLMNALKNAFSVN